MTMKQKLLGCAMGLGLGMGLATGANAAIHTELGASNFLSAAEVVGSGINQINGSIGNGDEGDLFRVTFATGGTLTISTSSSIDPEIFLFSASGGGIGSDDDSGPGIESLLTVSIAAGTYYIGIGDFNTAAQDTDGTQWTSGSPPGSFGTLNFIQNTSFIDGGNYSIYLSLTTGEAGVPEPMTLGLLGAGLIGLGAAARRRRS